MFTKRIIPCLDVNNGRVVKGVNFVNLRDAGESRWKLGAAAYDKARARDEVVFLDITASSDARQYRCRYVRKVAEKCIYPVTVGGGIRTVDDFRALLKEEAQINYPSIHTAINTPNLRFLMRQTNSAASAWLLLLMPAKEKTEAVGIFIKMVEESDVGIDAVEWAMKVDKLEQERFFWTSMDCGRNKSRL